MEREDIKKILSLDNKKELLKGIGQEDLLDLFQRDYLPAYTPPVSKKQQKAPLDQQISFAISKEEKEALTKALYDIRKTGPAISISSYVRNTAIASLDLEEWSKRALSMLKRFELPEYDESLCMKQELQYIKLLEDAEDEEDELLYSRKLEEVQNILSVLKSKPFYRAYRVSGRVTFNEAQHIRWRSARLALSVSEYMRYMLFSYFPGGPADLSMSLPARKRFYVSVLDVQKNGFGDPPDLDECPNCLKYREEIEELQEQIRNLNQQLRWAHR